MEHAVDKPPEVPLGGVDELCADRIRRRVDEHDSDVDDELTPGRDDEVAEIEGEQPARV